MDEISAHETGLKPNEIKARLIEAGIAQKAIAETLGVTAPAVSSVIAGTSVSKPVRELIAINLGLEVDKIWPPRKKSKKPIKLITNK